jgi:nucleoside recognition membrane protein YjiH
MGLGRWGFFEQLVTLSRRFALVAFDVGEGRVPGLALDAAALLLGHLGVGSLATDGLRSGVASERRG